MERMYGNRLLCRLYRDTLSPVRQGKSLWKHLKNTHSRLPPVLHVVTIVHSTWSGSQACKHSKGLGVLNIASVQLRTQKHSHEGTQVTMRQLKVQGDSHEGTQETGDSFKAQGRQPQRNTETRRQFQSPRRQPRRNTRDKKTVSRPKETATKEHKRLETAPRPKETATKEHWD
jgi:hypothetical protein